MTNTPDEPLRDDEMTTTGGGPHAPGKHRSADADGTDADATDTSDGDARDTSDGDAADADGTDGGDADGTDGAAH